MIQSAHRHTDLPSPPYLGQCALCLHGYRWMVSVLRGKGQRSAVNVNISGQSLKVSLTRSNLSLLLSQIMAE